MFAQAEHKKTAQDLGIHSPLYPVLTPRVPQPDPSPRGMCTEVVIKQKGKQQKQPPPPPRQPGDPPPCTADPHLPETRRRAQWRRSEAEVEGGQESCRVPGPNQQRHPRRPCRHGQSPQWSDTGGHDGRRAPRTNKAGKTHQPAVSPSRTRIEAGPKRSPPYSGIHHRVHNLIPAPEGCAPR